VFEGTLALSFKSVRVCSVVARVSSAVVQESSVVAQESSVEVQENPAGFGPSQK